MRSPLHPANQQTKTGSHDPPAHVLPAKVIACLTFSYNYIRINIDIKWSNIIRLA